MMVRMIPNELENQTKVKAVCISLILTKQDLDIATRVTKGVNYMIKRTDN